mgnify:CR=1 FL=1
MTGGEAGANRDLAVVHFAGPTAEEKAKELEALKELAAAAAATAHHIAEMVAAGWNVVITHGSGPQVGFILRRSELALPEVAPVPMDGSTSVL